MKKICVFSDSHFYADEMIRAIREESPDFCYFLGDGAYEVKTVAEAFPNTPIYAVRGNCDLGSDLPEYRLDEVEEVTILAVHGHLFDVKYDFSLEALKKAAREACADVVLFGHTHKAFYKKQNGLIVVNPGTIGQGNKLSYAVVTIDGAHVEVAIRKIAKAY